MHWLLTHPFEGWGAVFDVILAGVIFAAALYWNGGWQWLKK
jgi:hypothetical protein